MKTKGKKILIGFLIIIIVISSAFFLYINDYYKATEEALLGLQSTATIEVSGEDPTLFYPQNEELPNAGVIFYPGGKVESDAYSLFLNRISQKGYAVFLVDMPFNLAVFDIDAAEDIIETNSHINEWYLVGHSLGGSMAAIFAEKTDKELAGLVLLAAYSTVDLSQANFPVLSLYGSEDKVIARDKLLEYRDMLPDNHVEIVIQGGNHAQFGNYGPQKGDGKPTITSQEQQKITIEQIYSFIDTNGSD